jgi:hypothetical protein
MPERILALSQQVSTIATGKVEQIVAVTHSTKLLALNASIEASRAGAAGAGFMVVSKEVGDVSARIEKIANELNAELKLKIEELNLLGGKLVTQIRGSRLADLALNMIDVIDRNLYERSCDVRWWATDSAVVDCVTAPTAQSCEYASSRLGVILDAYTVYLDLWIADRNGRVLANGRPGKYRAVKDSNVAGQEWFQQALRTGNGEEFVACDVAVNQKLENELVATYATAIREGGRSDGAPIGALGIFFDWRKQSQAVLDSVRLSEEERALTRCLILDSKHRIIASSDRQGLFETLSLQTKGEDMGNYAGPDQTLVGFALTPGYETYRGLGWYGVLTQCCAH